MRRTARLRERKQIAITGYPEISEISLGGMKKIVANNDILLNMRRWQRGASQNVGFIYAAGGYAGYLIANRWIMKQDTVSLIAKTARNETMSTFHLMHILRYKEIRRNELMQNATLKGCGRAQPD